MNEIKNSELQIEVKQVWESTLGKNRVPFSEEIQRSRFAQTFY